MTRLHRIAVRALCAAPVLALAATLMAAAQDSSSPSMARVLSARRASGTATPITHVVVIYQENHSFDETLGAWCQSAARCDGFTGTVTLKDGAVVPMKQSPDVVPIAGHTVKDQVTAIDGGKMDGWDQELGCTASSSPAYGCLTYYVPSQIPNLTNLANKFAVSDRTFSMRDSPSWGGHLYAAAASTDGFTGENPHPAPNLPLGPGWGCDSNRISLWVSGGTSRQEPSCVPDPALGLPNGGAFEATNVAHIPTIMDSLDAAHLAWKIYAGGSNYFSGAWTICPSFADCLYTGQKANMVPTASVITDAGAGNLPNFSIVIPTPHGGTSQHNGQSMLQGDNWIGQVVSAIEAGPQWGSTAIFITYDDCGCFYDHVIPLVNPDGTQEGPRVPLVIVSPYARAAFTDSTLASFASILAFTEHTFGLLPLGVNDSNAYDFSNSFDYSQVPLAPVITKQSGIPAGEDILGISPDDPT